MGAYKFTTEYRETALF